MDRRSISELREKINAGIEVRFGRLKLIEIFGVTDGKVRNCRCACDCGNEWIGQLVNARNGNTNSCGCLAREMCRRRTHGLGNIPEYKSWTGLRERCYRKSCEKFPRYGARGINVCNRWLGRNGFANFMADMGRKPSPLHSIERKDNDGDYEPGNCVWATNAQQAANRSTSLRFTIDGRTECLKNWCRHFGQRYMKVYKRMMRGWSFEQAMGLAPRPPRGTATAAV